MHSDHNKILAAHAWHALVAWMLAIRDVLAAWLARGTRKAERKKARRRDTDQRLRRMARREGIDDDCK
jgi:hypothetical protein